MRSPASTTQLKCEPPPRTHMECEPSPKEPTWNASPPPNPTPHHHISLGAVRCCCAQAQTALRLIQPAFRPLRMCRRLRLVMAGCRLQLFTTGGGWPIVWCCRVLGFERTVRSGHVDAGGSGSSPGIAAPRNSKPNSLPVFWKVTW